MECGVRFSVDDLLLPLVLFLFEHFEDHGFQDREERHGLLVAKFMDAGAQNRENGDVSYDPLRKLILQGGIF